jgi:hypothetical protein
MNNFGIRIFDFGFRKLKTECEISAMFRSETRAINKNSEIEIPKSEI